jgi:uncharacterized protein YifN (PemK superfamily)
VDEFEKRAIVEGWIKREDAIRYVTSDDLAVRGWIQRTRRQHSLHGTPRVGQVFWIDFPSDAYAPEFENEHPGIIVRAAQSMSDTTIIIPMTHRPAENNPHAHKLTKNPNRDDPDDAWAICNHLYTVSLGRLRRLKRRGYDQDIRIAEEDKKEIFTKIQRALHVVFASPQPLMAPPAQPRPVGPNTLSIKPK